jgi:hypothetical protein
VIEGSRSISVLICRSASASDSIAMVRSIAAPSVCASDTNRLMSLSSKRRSVSEAAIREPNPPEVPGIRIEIELCAGPASSGLTSLNRPSRRKSSTTIAPYPRSSV